MPVRLGRKEEQERAGPVVGTVKLALGPMPDGPATAPPLVVPGDQRRRLVCRTTPGRTTTCHLRVAVDQGFGLSQMTALGSRLRHLDPAHVSFATLPVLSSSAVRVAHGLHVDVVLLDPARTAQLFAGLHDGTGHPAPGTGAATGQPLTVPPAAFSLEVRNGPRPPGWPGASPVRCATTATPSPHRHRVSRRPDHRALPSRHARRRPDRGHRPARCSAAAQPHPDRRGPARPGPRTHRPWSRCTGPAQPHQAGALADRPPPQPTAAVGVSRRCLRALIKTPSGDQGATGLLCRSAGLPPPDRPRREMRQTDRWLYRPSALPSYLPGHQAGVLRHYTKHWDRSRRLRCGPGRAGLRRLGAKDTADRPT